MEKTRPKAAMKQLKPVPFLLALAALALGVSGCATQNVNPPRACAHTGYVDFHADSSGALYWQVARFDERARKFQNVFSDLKPPPDGVLRLAFAPGHHRLQVTFLNRVIAKPAEVEVEVQDGKIIPVGVTLTEAGTALVVTKELSRGGTVKGTYGRRTEISSNESIMYGLSAVADPPAAYQTKERMPYAR
jgi:hypothetical protein